MSTRTRLLVTALAAWSLFVWVNRITNAWTGTEGLVSKLISTVFAVALLVAAIAAVSEVWRRRSERAALLARVLAGGTIAVWLVRLPLMFLFGGWGIGFLVVHTVLALASMALAAVVWRSVGRDEAALEASPRPPLVPGA
jgi:hypothetical protein